MMMSHMHVFPMDHHHFNTFHSAKNLSSADDFGDQKQTPAQPEKPTASRPQEGESLGRDYVPPDDVVICGKGRLCYNHAGNKTFRELVTSELHKYQTAKTKSEKTVIVMGIVDIVKSRCSTGIGFVRQRRDGNWEALTVAAAREKVGHTVREAILYQDPERREAKNKKRAMRRRKKQQGGGRGSITITTKGQGGADEPQKRGALHKDSLVPPMMSRTRPRHSTTSLLSDDPTTSAVAAMMMMETSSTRVAPKLSPFPISSSSRDSTVDGAVHADDVLACPPPQLRSMSSRDWFDGKLPADAADDALTSDCFSEEEEDEIVNEVKHHAV